MLLRLATLVPDQICATNAVSLVTILETAQGSRLPPTALQLATPTPGQTCATSAVSPGTLPETARRRLVPPSARVTETAPLQEDTAGSPMSVVPDAF
jgi:hypothetical protein